MYGQLGPVKPVSIPLSLEKLKAPYNDPMCCGCTDAPRDCLEPLLDVDYQATFDWRDIDPFTVLVQHLQSACAVLRKECEKPGRVLVGANSLRVGGRLWIFDEFEPTHVSFELVESVSRKRQTFRYQVHKFLRQVVDSACVFLHKFLGTRMLGILKMKVSNHGTRQKPKRIPDSGPQASAKTGPVRSKASRRGYQNRIAGSSAMEVSETRAMLTSRRSGFAAVVSAPRRV